jgi:membrane-associated phospholipid phosphatase
MTSITCPTPIIRSALAVAVLAAPVFLHAADCPAPPPTGPLYLLSGQLDTVALLPPPPTPDSMAQQRDLDAVLEAQRKAHENMTTAHAVADAEISCGRFADVLGDALQSKSAAKALAFLNKAAVEGAGLARPVKRYWQRPRPYVVSAQVERLADMAPNAKDAEETATAPAVASSSSAVPPGSSAPSGSAGSSRSAAPSATGPAPAGVAAPADDCARPAPRPAAPMSEERRKSEQERAERERAYSSYPSGHSTFGTVCAILLADMVPEKRAELFARGRDYGASRLVVGAHFPDDVENGRTVGTLAAGVMMESARFQRDFLEARTVLRAALGFPAELPDLAPKKR